MNAENQLEKWRHLLPAAIFQSQKPFGPGQESKVHSSLLKKFYPGFPLLPIEFLKHFPDQIEAGFAEKPIHSFLSSGTTQRDRSRSSFSKNGLDHYHEFSLLSFRAMLKVFFPETENPRGYSMIPSVAEWPSSSLAQMVDWIGDEFPLTYWEETTPAPTDKPVWLFATGFHIVAFADAGGKFILPKGSIVIETGGTKGKTRSVSREESYALIEASFGVDRNHIVSEYGMCELASQAYDFVDEPQGPIVPLQDRRFRFPAWAQTRILAPDQTIAEEGDGTLIIDDRIRSDIGTPFRTEDRVRLDADGSFQLQGRVAFSPLKGCSLLAEDLLRASAKPQMSSPVVHSALPKEAQLPSQERAEEIHRITQKMLCDPEFLALIKESLGIEQLAVWCLEDIERSVPQTALAWLEAATATKNEADSWLMIAPRTHDFALMHPLFLAALLNLRVVVREAVDARLLEYWQKIFDGFWSFEIIDSNWRLSAGDTLPCHSLLAYGSDETIHALQEATPQPVQGFGNWITITVIHQSHWLGDEWVKDAFSLKQQGCMSSRLLIVWDESVPEILPERSVAIGALTHGDHLHLAHSELDLALEGWELLARNSLDDLVVGQRLWKGESAEELLSARPLTLPVLRVSRQQLGELESDIAKNSSFKLISADALSRSLLKTQAHQALCDVGMANAAKWTGIHGGRPLFFPQE